VLSTNIQPPEADGNDESQVLPAFLKLLNLFRIFDHANIFDIIQGDSTGATTCRLERDLFDTLQRRLQEGNLSFDLMPDVQKADVCVTKHWMRMILWRLSSKKGPLCKPAEHRPMSLIFPVVVAKEFLNMVSQLPRSAVEAHGIGMQLKIYEIANSVVDAISDLASLPRPLQWAMDNRPSNILARLHSFLSAFRGEGNKTLVNLLHRKMAEAQLSSGPSSSIPFDSSFQLSRRSIPHQARGVSEVQDEEESNSALITLPGGPTTDFSFSLESQVGLPQIDFNSGENILPNYCQNDAQLAVEGEAHSDKSMQAIPQQQASRSNLDSEDIASMDILLSPFLANNVSSPLSPLVPLTALWPSPNSAEMLFGDMVS